MADAGVVEFDADRGVVEPSPQLDDAEFYLEVVAGNEFPWSELYLGLSGVFAGLTAVVWLGIWPFNMIPTVEWLVLVVVTMGASAACHRHQNAISKLGGGDHPGEVVPPEIEGHGG